MKLQIEDFSPPLIGLIIGLPVYVLMNMANLHFQPEEVLQQMEAGNSNYSAVFIIGKLLSLSVSVFVAAGVSIFINRRQTPWPLRIVAFVTAVLSVTEAIINVYPLWFSASAILCCVISTVVSRLFIHKFSPKS